jgi:O-antigen ligase
VAGLYGFRGTFEPLALLVITLILPLSAQWVRRIVPALLIVGAIVSLFAIFQVFVLGYPFLQRYFAVNGYLPTALSFAGGTFPRAIGTFFSPNQLSLYLTFLILLGMNLALRLPRWRWPTLALVGLLSIALLLTVSRSGWVALLAGVIFSGLIWRRKGIFVLPLLVLVLVAVPLGLALDLDRYLVRTVSLSDPSAAYRLDINQRNLETVLENPFGIGLGLVGGRALNTRILGDNAQLYNSESYYLQTAMELGIPGLLLFLILIMSCGYTVYDTIFRLRDRYAVALAVGACACVVAAMTHAFFIAEFQDLTVASYLWFLVGLAMRLPGLEEAKQVHVVSATPALITSLPAPAAD